ncbi:unnamed protein product [Brachionus calyciflorus]|uniref:Integrase catalytic domain-containing protein n=1 Tax=Brachionus calyciflorus TaxID=104777 RepID=A0A814ADN9_9BILA|nr:unnamed protein product [Brachionus calyciflorus]
MLLELLYEKFDIKQLRTTAYHPECDGQSERFVQTIKSMIRCYVQTEQSDWDVHLAKLSFAYNSAVHNSTGFSPHEMVFGHLPRIPLDLVFKHVENSTQQFNLNTTFSQNFPNLLHLMDHDDILNPKVTPTAVDFCDKQIETFKEIYEQVIVNRNIIMDKAKLRHDRKIKKFEYEVGDLVLTDHVQLKKGLSSGLVHKYHGPFTFIGKHPNGVNYVIRKLDGKRSRSFLIHKNRLKQYFVDQLNTGVNNSNLFINKESNSLVANSQSSLASTNLTINNPKIDRIESSIQSEISEISPTSTSRGGLSFRPYCTKKTNRKTKKSNNISEPLRRGLRKRKAPERFDPN